MGRINLTPLRVRRRALADLDAQRTRTRPCWLDIVGDVPPPQILVRHQPIPHPLTKTRATYLRAPSSYTPQNPPRIGTTTTTIPPSRPKRKPSRVFAPVQIRYEEDALRKKFFSDHPWELARPRVVLETSDGDNTSRRDYAKSLAQPHHPVTGEDVVQRQLALLRTNPEMTEPRAYDVARKEFYDHRRQQDIARRVAVEEAEHAGACFGPGVLQWGMQVESKVYDQWEEWSRGQVVEMAQRNASFAGAPAGGGAGGVVDEVVEDTAVRNDGKAGSNLFATGDGRTKAGPGRRA